MKGWTTIDIHKYIFILKFILSICFFFFRNCLYFVVLIICFTGFSVWVTIWQYQQVMFIWMFTQHLHTVKVTLLSKTLNNASAVFVCSIYTNYWGFNWYYLVGVKITIKTTHHPAYHKSVKVKQVLYQYTAQYTTE